MPFTRVATRAVPPVRPDRSMYAIATCRNWPWKVTSYVVPCFTTATLSVNGSAGFVLFGFRTALRAEYRSALVAFQRIGPVTTSWSRPSLFGRTKWRAYEPPVALTEIVWSVFRSGVVVPVWTTAVVTSGDASGDGTRPVVWMFSAHWSCGNAIPAWTPVKMIV